MNIFDDRIQITPYDKGNVDEINEYIAAHPEKLLRLYWFENPEDFSFVSGIKKARKISINYSTLADLHFLDYFPQLEYLDINEVKGKADLSVLRNQTSLKTLILQLQGLTNQNDLSVLNGLEELKEFQFSGKFKKKSLSLTNLKALETIAPQIKDMDLNEVQQLTKLKSFHLYKQKVDTLEGIENLKSLETVVVNGINIKDQGILSPVFAIEKLETLSISYVKAITDLSFILQNSHLKSLSLWSLNGLESLHGLEKLIALEKYSQCGDHKNKNTIDFSILQKLNTLKEVEVKVGIMSEEAQSKLNAILGSLKLG